MKKRYHIIAICYDKRGKILSIGTNSYEKTHPLMEYFRAKVGHAPERIFLHAEIAAILKARGKQIYRINIIRHDKYGNRVTAKPCPICQEAIKAFGIKVVEFN